MTGLRSYILGKRSLQRDFWFRDLRGCAVVDQSQTPLGRISEIFMDRRDLRPRYVEVSPPFGETPGNFTCPIEIAQWDCKWTVYLDLSLAVLRGLRERSFNYVTIEEAKDLLRYSQLEHPWPTSMSSGELAWA